MKEYIIERPDGTKEYIVEFTYKEDKKPKLKEFLSALDFVHETEEFTTSELQIYLKCGYGTVCKVLDALCLLCVLEAVDGDHSSGRCRYRRLLKG